jgi:hypothetical protein
MFTGYATEGTGEVQRIKNCCMTMNIMLYKGSAPFIRLEPHGKRNINRQQSDHLRISGNT